MGSSSSRSRAIKQFPQILLALILFLTGCNKFSVYMDVPPTRNSLDLISVTIDEQGYFNVQCLRACSNNTTAIPFEVSLLTLKDLAPGLPDAQALAQTKSHLGLLPLPKNSLAMFGQKKTIVGQVRATEIYVHPEKIDPALYYLFQIRSLSMDSDKLVSAALAKVYFPDKLTTSLTTQSDNSVVVSWPLVDGASHYELFKDNVLVENLGDRSFAVALEEAVQDHKYCVRPTRGALVSPTCLTLERIGSDWRPIVKELTSTTMLHGSGNTLRISVGFSEALTLNGLTFPQLPLELGATRFASYRSGNGSKIWEFDYQIVPGDNTQSLVPGDALTFTDSSSLQSKSGIEASLSLPLTRLAS
ncbi:MAG: hypothetical protein EOP04_21715, partial [Proteobacteria bacterium]